MRGLWDVPAVAPNLRIPCGSRGDGRILHLGLLALCRVIVKKQRSDRRLILAFLEVRQFDKMAWLCGGGFARRR